MKNTQTVPVPILYPREIQPLGKGFTTRTATEGEIQMQSEPQRKEKDYHERMMVLVLLHALRAVRRLMKSHLMVVRSLYLSPLVHQGFASLFKVMVALCPRIP